MMMNGNNKLIGINMKKIIIYTSLLAAITLSCSKLENEPIQKGQEPDSDVVMITEKISGGRKVSSKATIDNDNASIFKWSVGDAVAVHVSKGDDHKYVTSSGADVAEPSASFTVTYEEGYTRDAFAIYPSNIVNASASNYGQSGTSLDVTLPANYTLDQVTDANGEKSPCPMIAYNTGTRWDFYQLCGLLRLTVNSIPAGTKRLEIDFDGKNVAGNFTIPSPVKGDGTSTIALSNASGSNSTTITITKDGTDVPLLNEGNSLVLNVSLPTGDYSNIYVVAYDAISGGNSLKVGILSFNYQAKNTKGVKRTITLSDDQSIFSFTFEDGNNSNNPLNNNLRFVRLFSCNNKLYSGSTYGPYTVSSATDMNNPVKAMLKFTSGNDQLAFQVVTADGKVYSGLYNAPDGGFEMGKIYALTVTVKDYKFTVETTGKQVYFSPGDLGVDNGVYSFTEPFTDWEHGNISSTAPTKRVWFDMYIDSGLATNTVYGITWKNLGASETSFPGVPKPYQWNNLVYRTNLDSGVDPYYKVTIPDHQYCLLLPPDETQASDIGEDLTEGTVTDYAKYLGKGFVLLFNTNRGLYSNNKWSWGSSTGSYAKQGFYWAYFTSSNRYYFTWPDAGPKVDWGSNKMRNHIRYVRDVE